jgi:hypothetical protein
VSKNWNRAWVLLAGLSSAAIAGSAGASAIIHNADHVTVSVSANLGGVPASASADFVTSGNLLTVTLRNTSTDPGDAFVDMRSSTLTGLQFNFGNNTVVLTPVSATIAAGSILNAANCTDGCGPATTNVGGEFAFKSGLSGGNYGISSTIHNDSGQFTTPSFGGPNLDDPNVVDGINFGIVQQIGFDPDATDTIFASEPMIQDQVVFVFSGVSSHHAIELGLVAFLYGTQPANTVVDCSLPACLTPGIALPEPTGLSWLGLIAAGALSTRRRRRA